MNLHLMAHIISLLRRVLFVINSRNLRNFGALLTLATSEDERDFQTLQKREMDLSKAL